MIRRAECCWVGLGFQTTVLPISAGRGRQVARDRGEVERRDRVDEALERPVVGAVPDAGAVGDRLLGEDLLGVVDVEPPEVDQLARRVDLGLERRLRLAEHGRGVEPLPPRPGEQLGGLEEDRAPLVERHRPPLRSRLGRRVDRALGVGLGRVLEHAQRVRMVVRLDHARSRRRHRRPTRRRCRRPSGARSPPAGASSAASASRSGGAGRIGQVGLVDGSRGQRDGVHAPDVVRQSDAATQPAAQSAGGALALRAWPGTDVVRRPRGARCRPADDTSSSSSRASRRQMPSRSASGTRSRSAVMP